MADLPSRELPRSGPPARPRPPLWARWVLSLGVGLILLVALVVFVEHNNSNSEGSQNPAAVARANREAQVVVGQDQAPHVGAVAPGQAPRSALAHAVGGAMRAMIAVGTIDGPLQRTGCTPTGHRHGDLTFKCTAVAAHVSYPFLGVVNATAHRLVYCKRDQPPVPSMDVPVSRRCTA